MALDQLDMAEVWNARYPNSPGHKRAGTSKAAAEAIKPRAKPLRERVLDLLKADAMTADECAHALKETVLSVRPRLSELVKMDLIYDTGLTSKNASGVQATIWRAHI